MSNTSNACGGCNVSTSYAPALMQYFTSTSQNKKKVDDILKQFKTNNDISNNFFLKDNYLDKTKGLYGTPQTFNPIENYAADRQKVPIYSFIK